MKKSFQRILWVKLNWFLTIEPLVNKENIENKKMNYLEAEPREI